MSILNAVNLYFSYDHRETLKNISFSLNEKEICVILGPNGSGKTTLLKCLNNIIKPQRGSILIENRSIDILSSKNIAKKISYLPQETGVSFSYSVFDIVLMGRAPYVGTLNKPSASDLEVTQSAINTVGIQHLQNRPYANLSGGEKKLVMIARSLAQDSKILMLDEPTNHLDFRNQFLILNKIKQIVKDRNLSLIMALHDPNLALMFSDRAIMIKSGQIIAYGSSKEVINEKILGILYGINMYSIESNGKRIIIPRVENL